MDRFRHTLRLTTTTTPAAADAGHNGGERPENHQAEQPRLDEQESHGTSQDEWKRKQGCRGTLQAPTPSANCPTNDDDSPAGSGRRESCLPRGFQRDMPRPSELGSRQHGPSFPCDDSHEAGGVTLAEEAPTPATTHEVGGVTFAEEVPIPSASNDPRVTSNDCGGASAPAAGTALPLNKSETVGLSPMESGQYEDDFHDFSDSDEGNDSHEQPTRATVEPDHNQERILRVPSPCAHLSAGRSRQARPRHSQASPPTGVIDRSNPL